MLYNYNGTNVTKCLCDCDCGKKDVIKSQYNIEHLSTEYTSCGCQKRNVVIKSHGKDITGKKFNLLTINKIFWTEYDEPMVLCTCDCGNTNVLLRKHEVQSGHTKSCGCLMHKETTKDTCKNWAGYVSEYGVKAIKPLYKNKSRKWIWEWECPICHSHFEMLPAKIVNGHTTSCGCKKQSNGEQLIKHILDEFNIEYIPQYKFEDCKNKYVLKFDFAILKNSEVFCLFEYDGIQHFEPVPFFGGELGFIETKNRDNIKNEYCIINDIPLYRFSNKEDYSTIKQKITNIIYP